MTSSQTSTYKAALKEARTAYEKAFQRLSEISAEGSRLTDEIKRLKRTITALAALCSESPGFDDLGITDACTEVMEVEKGMVSTMDVVNALEAMGFDLASQKNPQASVHAILTRMANKGKIQRVATAGNEIVYWTGPNFEEGSITDEEIPF